MFSKWSGGGWCLSGMIWNALLHLPVGLWNRLKGSRGDTTPQAEVNREAFMGRWYEQARYENAFEYGLDGVYTDYTAAEHGRFRVSNYGTDAQGRRHCARGMGSSARGDGSGALRVSFVPPYGWFRAPYTILYVDAHYCEALVAGSGGKYLWLLTREAEPAQAQLDRLLREAQRRGFDTDTLRHTRQG